jgi:asparagine synthase (glutamine-hydrolysing)
MLSSADLVTALPSFMLEVLEANADAVEGDQWAKVNGRPVVIRTSNLSPAPFYREVSGEKFCVLGFPYHGDRIDNQRLCEDLVERAFDPTFLAGINGEFVILHVPANNSTLNIINCRFSYPPIWYHSLGKTFISAFNFSDIWTRLKARGSLKVDESTFFDLLRYKRVFGTKTPDRNTKLLGPAKILSFDGDNVQHRQYWHPEFKTKCDVSLDQASDLLIDAVRLSIRRKSQDGKRIGLFLSGGMDTRLVLAAMQREGLAPTCFTINEFENREVRVAQEVAKIVGVRHIFLKTDETHYSRTYDAALRVAAGMASPMCMFIGHREAIQKHADVGFHGHGFDYLFQGMYLPRRNLDIWGRRLAYSIPKALPTDLIGHFIENVPYRVKGTDVLEYCRDSEGANQLSRLRHELASVLNEADEICESETDKYEYLSFHNLARHYSVTDHWGINTTVEQRTIAFDNDVFDLFQQMPTKYRFDSRVQRNALRRLNPRLAKLMSANTTYPIGWSSRQRTLPQVRDAILRRVRGKNNTSNLRLERMGLPVDQLLVREWKGLVEEMIQSDRLEQLSFLDVEKAKAQGRMVLKMDDAGNNQFLSLLVSVDQFLKVGGV